MRAVPETPEQALLTIAALYILHTEAVLCRQSPGRLFLSRDSESISRWPCRAARLALRRIARARLGP